MYHFCFVENFSLTPGFSRVRMVCAEKKNRLNGFSWARSWFTALKRGVNEMISTEHIIFKFFSVTALCERRFRRSQTAATIKLIQHPSRAMLGVPFARQTMPLPDFRFIARL
jgi:hypothetical protein